MQNSDHPYDGDPRRVRARRRKRRRTRRRAAGCLFSLLLFAGLGWFAARGLLDRFSNLPVQPILNRLFPAETEDITGTGLLDGIQSRAAVLTALDDGKEIASLRADEELAPASLTKLVSVYAALQLLGDPQQTVTLDEELFPPLWEENASMAGLQPGETAPVLDLLYGALLPSGADACEGLAEAVGGESTLVDEMNRLAGQLGMQHSSFKNPTGLDEAGHYSTAADLTLLLRQALQDPTFRTVFSSWYYTSTEASAHPEGITFQSTLATHRDQLRGEGWEVLGGKTGFTDAAGLCLATLAEVGEKEYLLVTLGAPGATASETGHIEDAALVWSRLAEVEQ